MQRFLEKFRELLKIKASDGDLSADDLEQAMRQARAHVGGMASGEKRRMEHEAAAFAEQGHVGLMAGCWLPQDIAAQLAVQEGEAAENLHMTLCYCGDVTMLGDVAIAQALVNVESLCRYSMPLTGTISGIGRFAASQTSGGKDVLYASVDVPGLPEFRQRLSETLTSAGCAPRGDHGFTPHVTLAYLDPSAPTPDIDLPKVSLRLDKVTFAAGEKRVDLPLVGRGTYVEGCKMNEWRLLGQLSLSEDGKSGQVQIFPAVGTYNHPRYGELQITPEFLKRVKANFDGKVYQQELPLTIDLEHQSSLSGAAGWIASVDIKGETGMWAKVDFNERGKSLVAADAYRYFSPEFYDQWQDPATNKEYSDVLIGGALTNRPFFKGMAPVAMMSEGVLAFVEATMPMEKKPDDEHMMAEKTEDGESYPASAFLYAPEPDKPSTWKLRIWESPTAKVTKAQLGRAAAALGKGFRGNKVQLPAGEKEKCIARLKAEYSKLGVKDDEMPDMMRADLTEIGLSETASGDRSAEVEPPKTEGEPMGMSEEEARQFAETRDALKSLSERLAAETEARKAAEASAKTASERVAIIERNDRRRQYSEFVRDNRYAFEGEVETCVDRLERLATKLSAEEFDEYCAERKTLAGRIKASDAFVQISRPGPGNGTAASEFEAAKRKLMAEQKLDESAAVALVAASDPQLYDRFDREFKRQIKRGGD